MKNNYEIRIKVMLKHGKAFKVTRYVSAEGEHEACLKAEEFYEQQGYAAFCEATGRVNNLIPWDI